MKTLKSYINEGFYKNVGSDVIDELIIPWIKAVVEFPKSALFTPSGIPSDDQIRNALEFDGKRFVFNPKDIMHGVTVTVCFASSKDFNFYTNEYHLVNPVPEVSLGPALDLIRMDVNRINLDLDPDVSDKDIKRIFDAIHITDEKQAVIMAGSSGLTSLKNFRMDVGGLLDINSNNLKSFAGAGEIKCDKINASLNRELTSVAGLGSKSLKHVLLTGCYKLKSLKGLPPLSEMGTIEFLYNPELSIADGGFRDLIKGKTRLNRIGTDVHVFNDIDNKDVWGNVRVDNFTVYFNEDVPLPDNFPDLIPQCDNLILDGRYSKSAAIKRQIRKFKMNGLKPCVVFAWK